MKDRPPESNIVVEVNEEERSAILTRSGSLEIVVIYFATDHAARTLKNLLDSNSVDFHTERSAG